MAWTDILDPISVPKAIKAFAKILPLTDSPKANYLLDLSALALIFLCAKYVTKENFPSVDDNIRFVVFVGCLIYGAWFAWYCAKTHLIVDTREQ